MLKKRIFSLTIVLLSLAGLLLSYALAEEYYYQDLPQYGDQRAGIFTTMGSHVCGADDTFFSCESIAKSRYAVLFGFPVALFGIMYYLMTLFIALAFTFSRQTTQKAMLVALFWMAVWGVIVDIALFYVSFMEIKALCPLCLFTYAVNLLLFGIILFRLVKSRVNPVRLLRLFKTEDGSPGRPALIACIVLLGLTLLVGGGFAYAANRMLIQGRIDYIVTHRGDEIEKIVKAFEVRQPETIYLPALPVYGNAEAPVTIIEVSDFLCPYCARTAAIFDEIIKEEPDTVRVLFVNFPLDKTCNKGMRTEMHKGACELAMGAICAAAQGKLQAYQSAAFAGQKHHPTREDLNMFAAQAGMDQTLLDQCLENPETQKTLQWQIEAVQLHGINATPTFFINGKRYIGSVYKKAVQQIIDLEAKRVEEERMNTSEDKK